VATGPPVCWDMRRGLSCNNVEGSNSAPQEAPVPLGGIEIAGVVLGTGERVQSQRHIHTLSGQTAKQLHHLTKGGDGGGVILLQSVTEAAQAQGGGALAGACLPRAAGRKSLLPVRRRAVRAGQHRLRLPAQAVYTRRF